MVHLDHTKYSNHAQPRWQAEQLFHTFDVLKRFQLSCNTWAWAMDIALWVEYSIMMGVVWRRQKRRKSHIDAANGLGIAMQRMHKSYKCMKAQQNATKWVCIQLACSRRPRAFEEAHRRNIQAKFYNEKFPLVWKRQLMRLTIQKTWCYFEAQVWKKG